jgi:hypothetical protein
MHWKHIGNAFLDGLMMGMEIPAMSDNLIQYAPNSFLLEIH